MNISEINIYPIKSLKGISLENSHVEKRGLRYDRRWMLVDSDGIFFTQREVPKMATIDVDVNRDGVAVSSSGFESIWIPSVPDLGHRLNVTVWQSSVSAISYRGYVNEWFSDVLERKCQLVLMPESSERHVSEKFDTGKDIVSFADGYPLLLIGEASLDELNERIQNADNGVRVPAEEADRCVRAPLPMNRFRPNVVVTGTNPFEEDRWAKIKIGEATFRVVKPCARCVITTVDQIKGEFDGKEPLKTLASFRMAKQVHPGSYEHFGHGPTAVLFGENLIPESDGSTISVGDEAEVIERRS